jgi:hypothetical protein
MDCVHCRLGGRCRAFTPLPESAGPKTAAFAGRLLDDKGIHTLIAAPRLLRARGAETRLLIAGTPDTANPPLYLAAARTLVGRIIRLTYDTDCLDRDSSVPNWPMRHVRSLESECVNARMP